MRESTQFAYAPLATAELHYFAIPRDDWDLLLVRARQLGAHTIMARVPWSWHMLNSGVFDFVGTTDPQRDIVGFACLCSQLGLSLVLHPGPAHGLVLLGGGVPVPLLQHNPEACALDAQQHPWRDAAGLPSACLLHTTFLAAARAWIDAFTRALLACQAPQGSLTALWLGGSSVYGQIDYNPAIATYPDAPDRQAGDSHEFTRWYDTTAASIVAEWLRADGWAVPLDLATGPRVPLVPAPQHNTNLLAALFDHDARAVTPVVSPHIYGYPLLPVEVRIASNIPISKDGNVRFSFWRSKMLNTFVDAAAADFANARAPADIALGYVGASDLQAALQVFAQRLAQAAITFDILDLAATTRAAMSRYILVIVPGNPDPPPTIAQQFQGCSNIVVMDIAGHTNPDEEDLPIGRFAALPADVSIERLIELIEERGGNARYAWADGDEIDLYVRHGTTYTYLLINNRRATPYNGMLAYRSPDGEVLHLHTGIGAQRSGMVMLVGDEVYGVAIDGDGSQGGWLTRGLRSSVVFNTGAGALVRLEESLVFTAPQSGRLQARRSEGWAEMTAYRLLLNGAIMPVQLYIEATHLSLLYISEDEYGQTDLYLVVKANKVPLHLCNYLASLLAGRAALLRRAATQTAQIQAIAELQLDPHIADHFVAAANGLATTANQLTTIERYATTWQQADVRSAQAMALLQQSLMRVRNAVLAGALAPDLAVSFERQITYILNIATRLAY